MFVGIISSFAADLQMFSEARLINDPSNDGDSFLVEANGNSLHIRLYFVDCPEISITFKSGAERVREQTRYMSVILIIDGLFFTVFEGKYQFTSDLD